MPYATSPYPPGTPCWIDLMVPDQQAALDFYRDLFGWQGEVGPPETGGYSVCTFKDKPVAGIMATMAPDGAPTPPTAWTTYLATADADSTTEAITKHGGTVLSPGMDVMSLGRMAIAADPTGAVFGLWQARDFLGAQLVNEPGSLVWSELASGDLKTASAFYSAAVGLETEPMEGASDYFSLTVNGRVVGGAQGLDNLPPETPPHWLVYFSVDDTDSTVDALVRAGGNVLAAPFDMSAGRLAVVQDPQGAVFGLIDATGPELP